MRNLKDKVQEMENYMKVFRESHLSRLGRAEDKLESISSKMLDVEKRMTELEVISHQTQEKVQFKISQFNIIKNMIFHHFLNILRNQLERWKQLI